MRGCLFTLLLGGIVMAIVIVFGLPALAAGLVTGGLGAAGLVADDTTVTVSSDPPTDLLGLHADRVRVRASNATFRGTHIGQLELDLSDVAVLDRTAAAVAGRLTDVSVETADGPVSLARITIAGPGDAVIATAVMPGAQATSLIADAIESRTGTRPASVRLSAPDRLTVRMAGVSLSGRLVVTAAGDLVVRTDAVGPIAALEVTLLADGAGLPVKLSRVRVTPAGDLRLDGLLSIGILG